MIIGSIPVIVMMFEVPNECFLFPEKYCWVWVIVIVAPGFIIYMDNSIERKDKREADAKERRKDNDSRRMMEQQEKDEELRREEWKSRGRNGGGRRGMEEGTAEREYRISP